MVRKGSQGRLRGRFEQAAASLAEDAGTGLSQCLPSEIVQQTLASEGIKFCDCLFTPVVTLWMFLAQVLSADGSCRAAVAKLLAFLAAQGIQTPAGADCANPDTGPYCKARKRLPEGLVSRLAKDAGRQLHDRHPAGALLGGRNLKTVDGTTASMPDTPANQKQWPQPPTQKPGLGFPLVRLGRDDHVITMKRPAQRPEWMQEAEYEQLPETIQVREIRLRIEQPGFRVKTMILVTTLLDGQVYSKQEIAKAFRHRWHVELDIRAIKQTMNMSVLRCKTPAMVRKEIWMHILAYNLVRTLMAEAAEQAGIEPREASFAGAVQTVNAFAPMIELADEADRPRLMEIMPRAIARHRVGDRPDRYEPRAVKRRAKPIALLKTPRAEAKKRMAKPGAKKS